MSTFIDDAQAAVRRRYLAVHVHRDCGGDLSARAVAQRESGAREPVFGSCRTGTTQHTPLRLVRLGLVKTLKKLLKNLHEKK